MATWRIDDAAVERLYRDAGGARWGLARELFAAALDRGARRAFAAAEPTPAQLTQHLKALHAADLALACACAEGHEAAWEHFVREYRPVLYRAASAIDATGGARDLADSLYGELYGLSSKGGRRRSLLDYFHGRSSLATWLRAVLAQRQVDRARSARREAPLPEEDAPGTLAAAPSRIQPDQPRFVSLLRAALERAVARLAARERLRLACYYAQSLTLAEIGRALGEHEATVSRQLARTRRALREDVERQLREDGGLNEAAIAECFASVLDDAGSLDLADLLGPSPASKEFGANRST